MQRDFLFELCTEELPPKSLSLFAQTLLNVVEQDLKSKQLDFKHIQSFATPRRLALLVENLADKQKDQEIERKGPAIQAAFDAKGAPTQACLGFAKSCGVTVPELETLETDKGAWLYFKQKQKGQSAVDLLPDIINNALKKLPIPKPMRWGAYDTEFIRPVHHLIMLYGSTIVPCEILGLKSDNKTLGHRFLNKKPLITIRTPKQYVQSLEKAFVMAQAFKRKEKIKREIDKIAKKEGAIPILNDALLDEIASIVEWPCALLAEFPKAYLTVPKEALISSIQEHQKCIPLENIKGKLLPKFITIANLKSNEPRAIIEGNERVMNARLADAAFFFEQDAKILLETQTETLKKVMFQNALGSLFDKTKRIQALASFIAESLDADSADVKRAAFLCKADLMSSMVFEFPELQGIMGEYYAKAQKEKPIVAKAIAEHYLPRFAKDTLPKTLIGQTIALADRLDTLVGILGIGKVPTGDKDPFALRRAALGILRILIEKKLPLDLKLLIEKAISLYDAKTLSNKTVSAQTLEFILDRLKYWSLDQGFSANDFAAVRALNITCPLDFYKRLEAVQRFLKLPSADTLSQANKRVSNILSKQADNMAPTSIDKNLLIEPQEKALENILDKKLPAFADLLNQGKYIQLLKDLSSLQTQVNDFFEHVMVMAEDPKLKANRLALLQKLHGVLCMVADISLL